MNNSVGYRTIPINGRYIRGFGIPDYASKATAENKKRYKTIDDVPAWAKRETKELIDSGALRGNENGLDVTDDMLRGIIISKRYAEGLLK